MSEQEMRDRITRLETTVGDSSDDGLRGEIQEMKESVKTIFDRLRTFEVRLYSIFGGGVVVVWIMERVWK